MVAKAIDQDALDAGAGRSAHAAARLPPSAARQDDNFGIFASDTFVNLWERLTSAIAAMAVGIVSVFMVVGGIVIMNIMLAVVTERTHEIGIRKSLGARRRDILNQFLVESSMLAATGGLVGVLIAWAIAATGAQRDFRADGASLAAVFIGVGLSAIVGLFFGIYPARRHRSWIPSKPEGRSNDMNCWLSEPPSGWRCRPSAPTRCARFYRARRDHRNRHHHRRRRHPDRLRRVDHGESCAVSARTRSSFSSFRSVPRPAI